MSSQALIGWVIAALIASLVTILLSASAGAIMPASASAALFAASTIAVAVSVNQPAWKTGPTGVAAGTAAKLAQLNARLMALAYVWGALVLLVVYPLSGLKWYHAYQYGGAMGLFAIGLFAYSIAMGTEGSTLRSRPALSRVKLLTIMQGLAALCGLAFLIGSGKFSSTRVDWLANQAFAFGGLAIVGLSAIAAVTQSKLLR